MHQQLQRLHKQPVQLKQMFWLIHCSKEARHWCAGKTTLLRDVVSLLANKLDKRVVVVDTSNEIGGDGAVPHSCLGKARRMPVYDQAKQHEVLLQAVQNHNPQVIIHHSAALLLVNGAMRCGSRRCTWLLPTGPSGT